VFPVVAEGKDIEGPLSRAEAQSINAGTAGVFTRALITVERFIPVGVIPVLGAQEEGIEVLIETVKGGENGLVQGMKRLVALDLDDSPDPPHPLERDLSLYSLADLLLSLLPSSVSGMLWPWPSSGST